MKFAVSFLLLAVMALSTVADEETIHAYHLHTYFFQSNVYSTQQALELHANIETAIQNGYLKNCSLNTINYEPRGPHPIGSYETCCNETSLPESLSFFIQHRGNLSILLHPLTRFEVGDHTTRSMWLGASMPLDLSALSPVLTTPPICPEYPLTWPE